MSKNSLDTDHVDLVMAQWDNAKPELDTYPMALIARLARTAKMMGQDIHATFKTFGLQPSEFDILATIRRNNQAVTPTQLYASTLLTSGALTSRLNKLEEKQLITRKLSAEDKRSFQIELTTQGKELIDNALAAHLETEKQIVQPLTTEDTEKLNALLKKWLVAHENKS